MKILGVDFIPKAMKNEETHNRTAQCTYSGFCGKQRRCLKSLASVLPEMSEPSKH